MSYEELEVLYKFCYNRMNYDLFHKIMKQRYADDGYIEEKWGLFRNDYFGFIVSRGETVLFDGIVKEINRINYKG
jgi:hypothetical protein